MNAKAGTFIVFALFGALFAAVVSGESLPTGRIGENVLSTSNSNEPRGIRNNNPGNIRYVASNQWRGQTGSDEVGYAQFDEPENGIRAMGKLILNYSRFYGINTIDGLITKWAPESDGNHTQNYIDFVSARTAIGADQPIVFENHLFSLIDAIIYFENGKNPYSAAVINEGINRI